MKKIITFVQITQAQDYRQDSPVMMQPIIYINLPEERILG